MFFKTIAVIGLEKHLERFELQRIARKYMRNLKTHFGLTEQNTRFI